MERISSGVRSPSVATVAAVLLLMPCAARADDEPRTVLELSVGGAPLDRSIERGKYDVGAGLSLRVRAGLLEIGPIVSFSEGRGGDIVSDSLRFGGAIGYARSRDPWRVTILAEGGARRVLDVHERKYETEGPSLGGWSIDQRGGVTLPYCGVRAGIALKTSYEGSWQTLWSRLMSTGLSLFVRRDLATGTVQVDYSEVSWFRPTPVTRVSYRVGGWSAGIAVDLVSGW